MLLNHFRIWVLLGTVLILGCGSENSEYRPLTETSTEPVDVPTDDLSKPVTDPLILKESRPASPENMTKPETVSQSASPAPVASDSSSKLETKTDSSSAPSLQESASPSSVAATASPAEQNLIPGGTRGMRDQPGTAPATKPLEIKLLIPNKEFTREGKDRSLRVTFDDLDLLKVCNMEPVPPDVMDYLPDWLKNLNGQKIILRGWMFPSGRQEGISSFMFVRDNGICCFGRDPKVYDKLAVTMQPGKTTRYIAGRPFDVEATLLIEPDIEGTEEGLWWLYRLENARVIDQ